MMLKFDVYEAVVHFKIASKAALSITNELGIVPQKYVLDRIRMEETDKKRINKANH